MTTKGRFGFNIPSDKVLNDADRRIVKQSKQSGESAGLHLDFLLTTAIRLDFPEYFVEKVDLKKQAQKE